MRNTLLKQGFGLIEAKRYREVHELAIAAIKRDVADPAPYFLLARVAADHGNREKAPELFERARKLGADAPVYIAGHAQYLAAQGEHERAVALARTVAAHKVDESHVADTLGVILSRLGLHAEAVPFFQCAVALNAAPANYHYNLGASLQFSGDFAAAGAAYRECIAREADAYRAYTSLVSLKKQQPDDNWLAFLTAGFDRESDADARLQIGHAIAKTYEDMGDYGSSLDWLMAAKQSKRDALDGGTNTDLALFEAAAKTATTGRSVGAADEPMAPIFIVGLPRTGTTLVDRIISSHSDVVSAGELNTFAGLIKEKAASPSNRVLDAETLLAAAEFELNDVADAYLDRVAYLVGSAPRFTDKMPLNFFYSGLILRAFPNARVVALRRNPMDSCLSNYRQLFSTGFSYYNYSLSLEATANYYRAFDGLMTHWRNTLPPDRFAEFAYEDFVFDQEATTRRLLDFCALEWQDACLNFQENDAPVSTASSVQVRQPLYQSSVGRWRRYGKKLDPLKTWLDGLPDIGGEPRGDAREESA